MSKIVINPPLCAYSGRAFSECNSLVILKCGCALGSQIADQHVNDTGFVNCPVCEFAYTVKRKTDLVAHNQLAEADTAAQLSRCSKYETENEKLEQRLDVMVREVEPVMEAEEVGLLSLEDVSEVADSSEDDLDDFTAFESTSYARAQRRLAKLKGRRDLLAETLADSLLWGKQVGAPWVGNEAWFPASGSPEEAKALAARKRRSERQGAREARFAERELRRGASKVVHNVHVLHQQVPRKWAKDNPNAPKRTDWEEEARAKQGWLTADETEAMDEEEQEKVTAERRDAWRATQSKVPKLFGSVARQRWAERLYRLARQRHVVNEKSSALRAKGGPESEEQAALWANRLAMLEARVVATQALIDARCDKLARSDAAKARAQRRFFEEAVGIGIDEIEAEKAARVKAAEEAKRMAEEEASALAKAEAKAKAKEAAEAAGEEYVDPDEGAEEEDE